MAFNDGEPIDAAKLGELDTALAQIKARIPQFGSSTTNISLDNTALEKLVIPQMYGGISQVVALNPGRTSTFTINYTAAELTSPPKAILLTPVHEVGPRHEEAHVVKSSVGITTATCKVFQPKDATAASAQYYFLVIQHS